MHYSHRKPLTSGQLFRPLFLTLRLPACSTHQTYTLGFDKSGSLDPFLQRFRIPHPPETCLRLDTGKFDRKFRALIVSSRRFGNGISARNPMSRKPSF